MERGSLGGHESAHDLPHIARGQRSIKSLSEQWHKIPSTRPSLQKFPRKFRERRIVTHPANDLGRLVIVDGSFAALSIWVGGVEGEISWRRRGTNIRLRQLLVDRRVKRHLPRHATPAPSLSESRHPSTWIQKRRSRLRQGKKEKAPF